VSDTSKTYICERIDDAVVCLVSTDGIHSYYLKNIGLHSPDGFEMGYAGSGPADLALTILADHLAAEDATRDLYQGLGPKSDAAKQAWALHQDFKLTFITPFPARSVISAPTIDLWIERQKGAVT
jgi:hypothetical protein